MRSLGWLGGVALCAAAGGVCRGDYTLTPQLPPGAASVVSPGELFTVRLVLTSDTGLDVHNSAIVRVTLSRPGLVLEHIAWTLPYIGGGVFDDSRPAAGDLPVAITPDLLAGFGYPGGVSDVELSNVVPAGTFATGTLASVALRVPPGFAPASFVLGVEVDTLANGFDVVQTFAGPDLLFFVVPGPAAAGAMVAGALVAARRRR